VAPGAVCERIHLSAGPWQASQPTPSVTM
jgi:hypothetical protein